MLIPPVLKFITNHPLNKKNKTQAILRFIKWQINTKINPYPVIYPFTDRAKLVIQKGMTGATGNIYCGLHEFNDMAFLLHFLRKGDTFADIGANVGSFTVLASAHVGANSISFEPVPSTYTNLLRNISVNQIEYSVTAHNAALGAQKGTIDFTGTLDTMNHVATIEDKDTIKVNVEVLDEVLENQPTPILMKIDVEGFETQVIQGASKTLLRQELKAIIIELPGGGARYGFDESKIHDLFLSLNFKSYQYSPMERKLTPVEKYGTYNTLYVRDLKFVKERLGSAEKIKIRNFEI